MSARIRFFLWHLAMSALIAVLVVFAVFGVWYPSPLHAAVGVFHIFLMLLVVDVVLGPMLSLLVYRSGKKTLALDLVVIMLLQISALCYGLWSVAEGRPAWIVFNVDRFDLVRALDIDERNLEFARSEYQSPSWLGPKWVGADFPEDAEQRSLIVFESVMARVDIAQRPYLYRPLSDMATLMRYRARPLEQLFDYNGSDKVRMVLDRWPAADAWLPLMANAKPLAVLFRRDTAEIVAVVDLNPWL